MTADACSWPVLLTRLLAGTDLDADDTAWAMDQVMAGAATPAQVAAFLVALRVKGETPA
ncbi:MAG: anthranilate phosphoribosyltransferase, partial [Pseudonocardiaceae bacterium]